MDTLHSLSCTSFRVTAMHQILLLEQIFLLESEPASLSSSVIEGIHSVFLKEHKGQPFLLRVFVVIKYLLYGSPFFWEYFSTDYWHYWLLEMVTSCDLGLRCSLNKAAMPEWGGTWVLQAHPQGECNYFLSINQNGHTVWGLSIGKEGSFFKWKESEINFFLVQQWIWLYIYHT